MGPYWKLRTGALFIAAWAAALPRPVLAETQSDEFQLAAAEKSDAVQFNRDIRPLLSDRCFQCHGPDSAARKADLRFDRRESAVVAAIVPGSADDSELISRISSDDPDIQMPPEDSHKPVLTATQIKLFRLWIDQGAEYQPHWAYIPPQRPTVPDVKQSDWPRNEIDRFLLARQVAKKIAPSPEADRRTLIRRLSFDVIGLPPSPRDVEEFCRDQQSDAYERLVDRLLASPHFGERMASWWFDLVRFSDTVGYHGDQGHNIEPYRDYVVKSFNDNLPFDQFTVEQIAGDLLPQPTMWQKIATGYNRLLQTTHEGGAQDAEYRVIHMADRVRNLSETWLGSSLGCAMCHDHKFDPWTQKDFYSLGAFFADVDHYGSFEPVAKNDLVTQRPPEMQAWTLPIFQQVEQVDRRIAEVQETLDQLAGKTSDAGSLTDELAALRKQRGELEQKFVPTMVTEAVAPHEVRILGRGDWMDKTGAVVTPNTPEVLPPLGVEGRRATRLDLARWLTAPNNPLVARVLVNRLWKLAFGRGIAKGLIDVGSQAEAPADPALLDWLAVQLVDDGWDLKQTIRRMLLSSAYRQSSQLRPELDLNDGDNALFARQGRYRLDAEQIRDNALAVSGLLVNRLGDGYSQPYQPPGYYSQLNFPEREYEPSQGDRQFRRSVYMHWQRQFLHPFLQAFDAPSREECTALRAQSNTPSAALVLLNDPSMVEAARALATRLVAEAKGDDDARIRWAWLQVLGREPLPAESAVLRELGAAGRKDSTTDAAAAAAVEKLLAVGQSPPPSADRRRQVAAWIPACRALLNLNETISRE